MSLRSQSIDVLVSDWEKEQQYRLAIRGLPAGVTPRSLYDPITGKNSPLQTNREGDAVEVTVPVVDYPRLMVVE